MTQTVLVGESLAGERLDRALSLLTGISRAEAARMITEGKVEVVGRSLEQKALRLVEGDRLSFDLPNQTQVPLVADGEVVIDIVYADPDLIVVNKRAGQVVHPGSGFKGATMVAGLMALFPEIGSVGESGRPGVVHRLDKGTSGLMLFARTQDCHRILGEAFASHEIRRRYLALAAGEFEHAAGRIDGPIGRSERDRKKMAVVREGKSAATHYHVIDSWSHPRSASLVELELETGRTHQIRVHLSALGHPVLGDTEYKGPVLAGLSRPFLHSYSLELTHPISGEGLQFSAPLPSDLEQALSQFSR